jgi:hypothetical protein
MSAIATVANAAVGYLRVLEREATVAHCMGRTSEAKRIRKEAESVREALKELRDQARRSPTGV